MAKIIIALLICMFSISSISCDGVAYLCGGKSLKASDVCAFEDNDEKYHTLHIYDDCSKDEKCVGNGGHYYCKRNPKKKEIDEKCNYDADCLSNKCSDNKCSSYGEGKECKGNNQCNNGYFCRDGKCVKLLKSGADCGSTINAECGYALTCFGGKCTKWGSVSNGVKVGGENFLVCKSGMVNDEGNCFEINSHYDCEEHPEVSITDISIKPSGTIKVNCVSSDVPGPDGKFRRVPDISPYKTTAFQEFIKELEKVKPYDDLYDKKPNYFDEEGIRRLTLGNNEIRQKYLIYEKTYKLMQLGLIDKDGKILNKCEYRYYTKELSSKYLNIKTLLIILGLFLI